MVAVSGGPDSMAALDFLSRKKKVIAVHFNHETDHAYEAQDLVTSYCNQKDIQLILGKIQNPKKKGESQEEYWRNERYSFFNSLGESPIITCHHLDDSVEWWLFTSFNGNPKLIPHIRGKYIRPFLLNRKTVFEDWCRRKNVRYLCDPSNRNSLYSRSRIRRDILPAVLLINPGIHTVLKKKIINSFKKANPHHLSPYDTSNTGHVTAVTQQSGVPLLDYRLVG